MMLLWVQKQPYLNIFNGSDHFMAIGRNTYDFRRLPYPTGKWGSSFFNMPEMKRVTRLIIESLPWDDRDVSVPRPTGFHPGTGETLKKWLELVLWRNRSSLFSFVGRRRENLRNDFRTLLLSYCSSHRPWCRVVDCAAARCSADASTALEAFLGSEFCLQPVGDTVIRRSIFHCLIAGSVPVFFWKSTTHEQYKGFLPDEPESYSVFIDHEEVWNRSSIIMEVLMRYSKDEIRRKREKVIETIPWIIYGSDDRGSKDFEDAFDIALHGVMERIHKERESNHIW